MALYDSLFSQPDVALSQLLVTNNEFKDPELRRQLNDTVTSSLELRVVPIFFLNENETPIKTIILQWHVNPHSLP
jgi:delta-1-pyrroline-5-carboxylate synthetase